LGGSGIDSGGISHVLVVSIFGGGSGNGSMISGILSDIGSGLGGFSLFLSLSSSWSVISGLGSDGSLSSGSRSDGSKSLSLSSQLLGGHRGGHLGGHA
jgi:hypothetical protein